MSLRDYSRYHVVERLSGRLAKELDRAHAEGAFDEDDGAPTIVPVPPGAKTPASHYVLAFFMVAAILCLALGRYGWAFLFGLVFICVGVGISGLEKGRRRERTAPVLPPATGSSPPSGTSASS